jgi:hypothetical protein
MKSAITLNPERFKYLTNEKAVLPDNYCAPFIVRCTRVLIRERLEKLAGPLGRELIS